MSMGLPRATRLTLALVAVWTVCIPRAAELPKSSAGKAVRGYIVFLGAIDVKPAMQMLADNYGLGITTSEPASNMPRIYTGFSVNAERAQQRAAEHPDVTICITPVGDCHEPHDSRRNSVPMMFVSGQADCGNMNRTMAKEANAKGAREAYAWMWGLQHAVQYSYDIMIPYWEQCIQLRYPLGRTPSQGLIDIPREQGWLADMDSWETDCPYIASYQDYERDRDSAAWFPNRYLAFAYRAFCVGEKTWRTEPIVLSAPVDLNAGLGIYSEYNANESVKVTAQLSNAAVAAVDLTYGDLLIKHFSRLAYGVYSTTWAAVPGVHPIIATAYDASGKAIMTSAYRIAQVKGTPVGAIDRTWSKAGGEAVRREGGLKANLLQSSRADPRRVRDVAGRVLADVRSGGVAVRALH